MAVAFDAKCTAQTQTNAATTLTNSNLTVGTGSNRILIAVVTFDRVLPTITQFQWDKLGTPQNLTAITGATATNGTTSSTVIYALLNPTSGAKQLSITWTGTSEATLASISFTGADQTSVAVACPHGTGATGNTNSAAVTVTSAVGNQVVGSYVTNASGTISATNNNNIFIDNAGTNVDAAANYADGAASVALNASITVVGNWSAAATDILAAAGGVTDLRNFFYAPWREPVKTRSFPTPEHPFLFLPVPVKEDTAKYEWTSLWPDPVRSKRGLPAHEHPFLASPAPAKEDVPRLGWRASLSDPVCLKRVVLAPDQSFAPPQVTVVVTANILWYSPWSSVMIQNIMLGEG